MNTFIFTYIILGLFLVEFTAYVILGYLVFMMFAWPVRKLVGSIKSMLKGSTIIR